MTYRSLLFVPGARPDRFAKAFAAGADAVCIDLEDAVPPPEKAAARAATLAVLAEDRPTRPAVGLRLNALRTAAGVADLAALALSNARPDFVMMPKVAHAQEAAIIADVLESNGPLIWPIIESAAGLEQAYAIAAAPRIGGVLFGGADFAADLGVAVEWEPLFLGRATVVAAAARAGVEALDVPYLDVEDDAGCEAEARRSRGLGFTGKACIHPRQLGPVKSAFTPTVEERARAQRVLDAFAAAGGAAALLDGKLIEAPVVRAAKRVLAVEEN